MRSTSIVWALVMVAGGLSACDDGGSSGDSDAGSPVDAGALAENDGGAPDRIEPPGSTITIVTVGTVDELLSALAAATPGSVVHVRDDASLDLTGHEGIVVPAQVTLASGGGVGGAGGALLFTDQLDTVPLFRAGGAGVRFTGLRLRGPDPDIGATPYGQPVSQGILASHADSVQVDHCELSGWAHAAVALDFSRRAYVHHNSMHHNRRTGLGYGVVLINESSALIERNTFDFNRHAIAGTGRPGISYEARYNLIGPDRNGHAFDMHGENEADDNGSPFAGERIDIHHNTFRGTAQAIVIRGRPRTGAFIDGNCFGQSSASGTAIIQRFFTGNLFVGTNSFGQASGTCHEGSAPGRAVRSDVNGDGLADLVTLVDGTAFTYLGSPTGALVPTQPDFAGTMKTALFDGVGHLVIDVVDVNGDGSADLVTATDDGTVHVYPGAPGGTFASGVESFDGTYGIASQEGDDGFEPIAVADVGGDGLGDLVSQRGGTVYVHPGRPDATFGPSAPSFAGTFDSARFDGVGHFAIDVADVTGDGRADLVTVTHAGDVYLYRGGATGVFGGGVASFAGTFHPAFLDGVGFEPVALGDVNGDGRADLVCAHTDGNAYVYLGAPDGRFTTRVDSFHQTLTTSLFSGQGHEVIAALDVTGDGRVDLLTAHSGGALAAYPGSATGAFTGALEIPHPDFRTIRFGHIGYEPVAEKSLLRRRGCAPAGCL